METVDLLHESEEGVTVVIAERQNPVHSGSKRNPEAAMRYNELEHLSNREFKRLCGVSRSTFGEMVEVVRPHLGRQGRRGGQTKLSVEDQLLVALAYWREYRSQFHIGVSWGLHETTVGRMVKKVEDLLIKCGKFRLPSQRQLYQPGWEWKVMMVDVGEMEIERPQKNRNATTVASSATTP